jgi:hypothetical protein
MGHRFDRALWLHGSTKPVHLRNKEETMYTPRQIWLHVTPKIQLLIALALATTLAFSAGLAAGIYGRATSLPTLTTDRNAVPAVAQPPEAAPAVRQGSAVPAPVAGAGSAYDGSAYVEYLTGRSAASNQAAPLGIDLPAGAQRSDLPRGLTDYLRPDNTTSIIGMQSHPLGIDLPHGADVHDLPRGLTDYLHPQRPAVAAPVAGAGSAYDGSAYVEYLTGRSAAYSPNVPAIGMGSAYDGSAYVEYLTGRSAAHNPNVPISGTGSAYNGQ